MLERDIRRKVIAHAGRHGVQSIRMHFGMGVKVGWPDDLFLIRGGSPLFIEFKATGKEPTKKQEVKIERLQNLGYAVFVCDDVEEGKAMIDLKITLAKKRVKALNTRHPPDSRRRRV